MIKTKSLDQLHYENSFGTLPEAFYTRLNPTPLDNPKLVALSISAADLLNLSVSTELKQQLTDVCSGAESSEHFDPLAMVYSGHQFGGYSPQLGDGRGLLLGEVRNQQGEKWDLHLKGAGSTPYSRFGDGRAVLRSCIREYLASEALHHLDIPTTRALCVVTSDTPVYREVEEKGSTLLRLARTHIRFGHFEYFCHTKQHDQLKTLADFCIDQYFPELSQENDKYSLFFSKVVTATAELIAKWQAIGFAHGVMNTDNMSILGDTFDYGPYGFQDGFDWHYICNHSDHSGRYAFSQQPDIGYWNCGRLAKALMPLIENPEALQKELDSYPDTYTENYLRLMGKKLGLENTVPEDQALIQQLLQLLHNTKCDYTLFFRHLSHHVPLERENNILSLFSEQGGLIDWLEKYDDRLLKQSLSDKGRQSAMCGINPKYILRNHLAQIAIEKAEQGDYQEIEQLMTVLQSPFEEHPELKHYAEKPPAWATGLEISCSS